MITFTGHVLLTITLLVQTSCVVKHQKKSILKNLLARRACRCVQRFYLSFTTCQKLTRKGRLQKVPLVSKPVISEPSARVATDLVGPLTPSERDLRYILTLIDVATCFPDAAPLCSNTDTITVAESQIIFPFRYSERNIFGPRNTVQI